jgi:hypothetical protein
MSSVDDLLKQMQNPSTPSPQPKKKIGTILRVAEGYVAYLDQTSKFRVAKVSDVDVPSDFESCKKFTVEEEVKAVLNLAEKGPYAFRTELTREPLESPEFMGNRRLYYLESGKQWILITKTDANSIVTRWKNEKKKWSWQDNNLSELEEGESYGYTEEEDVQMVDPINDNSANSSNTPEPHPTTLQTPAIVPPYETRTTAAASNLPSSMPTITTMKPNPIPSTPAPTLWSSPKKPQLRIHGIDAGKNGGEIKSQTRCIYSLDGTMHDSSYGRMLEHAKIADITRRQKLFQLHSTSDAEIVKDLVASREMTESEWKMIAWFARPNGKGHKCTAVLELSGELKKTVGEKRENSYKEYMEKTRLIDDLSLSQADPSLPQADKDDPIICTRTFFQKYIQRDLRSGDVEKCVKATSEGKIFWISKYGTEKEKDVQDTGSFEMTEMKEMLGTLMDRFSDLRGQINDMKSSTAKSSPITST